MNLGIPTLSGALGKNAVSAKRAPRQITRRAICCKPLMLGILAVLGTLLLPRPSHAAEYSIPQVEAAFLFKFAQFTTWPARAFPNANSPLTIGVLGTNPFGRSLDNAVRGETVHDRPMAVKYSRRADELKDCQIVFISSSEAAQVDAVIATFRGSNILTVSDIPRFCQRGGMITFVVEGGRVRFEANAAAARKAGLQISSKLLKITKSAGD